jgi:dipeptidyl aminopeptidase/acylaminoacyl peptidase
MREPPFVARSLELDDLFRLQFVSDAQISPDGTRVAYVVTQADADSDENRSRIFAVDVTDGDGEPPRPLTAGPSDASPRWSPDGRWLAFVAKRAGDDRPQVWLLPAAGGEARRLTSAAGGASSPVWSPDGSRLAFLSAVDLRGEPSDEKEKAALASAPIVHRRLDYKADGAGLVGSRRQHLFVIDVPHAASTDGAAAKATQLTDGDFSVGGIAWSPTGDEIAYASAKHDDRDLNPSSSIFVVDLASATSRQVTPSKGAASAPAWSADGSTILFVGKADPSPGHARLFFVPADGGEPAELAPAFDRNVMVGAPGYPGAPPRVLAGGTVVFCARDRGCTHVYRLARGATDPEKILGGDDRVASAFTMTRDGSTIAFVSSSPSTTGEVHVASGSGTDERPLTAHAAALDGIELVAPEARAFVAPDGTEVHGWLLRDPQATAPGPLLLDVHGGPHNAWTPAFDGAHLYHQTLAALGWSVLTLNPRGSDGYGEAFLTALTGAWGRADIDDFLAPIDALVAEGIADPSRLAVTGYSYGGYMTCWLTTQTDRFAAAVPGGCLSNLSSFFGTSDVGAGLGAFEIGGDPWAQRDRFEDLSPITHVEKVRTPTLVLHGGSDDRCPVEQGEEWFTALRVLGCETEMVRYPGASHLFIVLGRPSHRIDYCRRVHDWVVAHTT